MTITIYIKAEDRPEFEAFCRASGLDHNLVTTWAFQGKGDPGFRLNQYSLWKKL